MITSHHEVRWLYRSGCGRLSVGRVADDVGYLPCLWHPGSTLLDVPEELRDAVRTAVALGGLTAGDEVVAEAVIARPRDPSR